MLPHTYNHSLILGVWLVCLHSIMSVSQDAHLLLITQFLLQLTPVAFFLQFILPLNTAMTPLQDRSSIVLMIRYLNGIPIRYQARKVNGEGRRGVHRRGKTGE